MPVTENFLPIDLLSIQNAADYLGTSDVTVRRWLERSSDPLPCYRIGGRIRISQAELAAWIYRRSGRKERKS